jgi:hypothetical protein
MREIPEAGEAGEGGEGGKWREWVGNGGENGGNGRRWVEMAEMAEMGGKNTLLFKIVNWCVMWGYDKFVKSDTDQKIVREFLAV